MATENAGETDATRHRRLLAGIIVALFVCLIVCATTILPRLVVELDLQGQPIAVTDKLRAINDARTSILQAIAGVALLTGAYAAWRRLKVNEEELRATRDGTITERFGRAIDHLGSDKIDVRMGGVYALERIGRNSPGDRDAIVATLSAFIRTHCPRVSTDVVEEDLPTLAIRAHDVQAAIIALGRLPRRGLEERIRVPSTDLRRGRLWRLNLDRALMGKADLRGARLWETTLIDADLGDADLRNADLTRARLSGAWLIGADLRGARLDNTEMSGSLSSASTLWPNDFDHGTAGVRVLSEREVRDHLLQHK